jgi:hypothetical protein
MWHDGGAKASEIPPDSTEGGDLGRNWRLEIPIEENQARYRGMIWFDWFDRV